MRLRLPIAAAALVVAGDELVYSFVPNEGGSRVAFVFASLAAGAALPLLGAASREPRARLAAVAAGACTLLIWSFLGAFSIGILILPAAILLLFATGRAAAALPSGQAWLLVVAASLVALATAALGLHWTST